ncbi:ATP-binding protein [Desulfovermiculus halophilus]|uniref:ATP-binding protein n=1 Tax=Desulfovermiculus halophilus TaxID=339722 RepID=UPI0005547660|nr:4Fe-4S binding protein [Desulfovermiculus halophilus]
MTTRQIIEIDEELCDGCGQCVPACEEGAIQIIDGKARLVGEKYCDGLGNCLGECPTGALRVVEREAEPFDEQAVQELLNGKQAADTTITGCPSAGLKQFSPCQRANIPKEQSGSALSHWPVQIRLVPPHAPFLEGADLLITADCAPVANAEYHSRFLPGKVALMGCPKFDDAQAYVDKFVEIFDRGDINSVTVLSMEVPCCSGLLGMVKKAKELSGSRVPIRHVIVGTKGDVIQEVDLTEE